MPNTELLSLKVRKNFITIIFFIYIHLFSLFIFPLLIQEYKMETTFETFYSVEELKTGVNNNHELAEEVKEFFNVD